MLRWDYCPAEKGTSSLTSNNEVQHSQQISRTCSPFDVLTGSLGKGLCCQFGIFSVLDPFCEFVHVSADRDNSQVELEGNPPS